MTTIINTPGNNDGGAMGMVIGLIIAAVIIVLFFVYGLPAIRGASQDRQPAAERSEVNINVTNPLDNGDAAPAPAE